ncbi:hypothetical protein [Pseudoclavibacter sp. CFCC 11306]|uniref:hypothetical protein n=1 Tax=Pseudoclavibacter sp. CFCC 11306 TaxID=1564493 RepID=UPI00130174D9|nr:hypothetical protein [Pseudoclavibacter sp. CFCC 11306]KAB1658153.1 hypothetical protein F8O09_00520 [Pseudoclavibacter sp. CFCC 11306]
MYKMNFMNSSIEHGSMNIVEQITIATHEIEQLCAEMDGLLAWREMLEIVRDQGVDELPFHGTDNPGE